MTRTEKLDKDMAKVQYALEQLEDLNRELLIFALKQNVKKSNAGAYSCTEKHIDETKRWFRFMDREIREDLNLKENENEFWK